MTVALVLARFPRGQIAGLLHPGEIKACGRKFRDFRPVSAADLDLEDVSADQFASSTFVHGEETATNPVPAVMAVRVVDAYHDLHLGLSPKAGTVGRAQPDAGIEIGFGVLAISADEFDSRLVIRVFAQVVVRQKLNSDLLGAGHLVFGMKLHPLSASADPVTFALVGAKGAALSADRQRCGANKYQD